MFVVNDMGVDAVVRVFYDVRLKEDWIIVMDFKDHVIGSPREGFAVYGKRCHCNYSIN